MNGTTRAPQRLPSDTGVTFEGFEDIKIDSREAVRERLEDFIDYSKDARKPSIRLILGEWGEGKTDAYRRYILPRSKKEGNHAFFVSASTISNSFSLANVQRMMDTTPLPSLRFLVALFHSIREERPREGAIREEGWIHVPEISDYKEAHAYMRAVLKSIIGQDKKKRLFIFIDEFEQLLLYLESLKKIVSGIKETINGQFAELAEGGDYEGCLHFIVSATPDALYQMEISDETSLLFGGFERRTTVIDLPQMRKTEGMKFLFELLRYSYYKKVPDPPPFQTSGILHGLFKIAQGNPGEMVRLFTQLLQGAMLDKNTLKIVDNSSFVGFLGGQQIFVYGGKTPCLEQETFYRFIRTVEDIADKELGKKSTLLLRILIGEYGPFSLQKLQERTKFSEHEIKNAVNVINTELKRRETIEGAVVKVSPLAKGKTFDNAKEFFANYIVHDATVEKDCIKIDNYLSLIHI